MKTFRLLLVEDDPQDVDVCMDSAEVYSQQHQDRQFAIVECAGVDEAFDQLDNSFDGAIIDLKLDNEAASGNKVVERISESMYRMPVAIFTGTPNAAEMVIPYIGVFKKGDTSYSEIFDMFWGIHNTGITQILGGRGLIEKTLKRVFEKNLLPLRDDWVSYGAVDSERTERAMLRHTINHLMQLLDTDDEHCYPEEAYIHPPMFDRPMTGSIVSKVADGTHYVVLNPACDLVIRKTGSCKTTKILVIEIQDEATAIASTSTILTTKSGKRADMVEEYLKNNGTEYYHWLPKTSFFKGGFLNFRNISTVDRDQFSTLFKSPHIQISSPFVKDIVARFSAYYARQGQPDIAFKTFVTGLTEAAFAKAQELDQLKKEKELAKAAAEANSSAAASEGDLEKTASESIARGEAITHQSQDESNLAAAESSPSDASREESMVVIATPSVESGETNTLQAYVELVADNQSKQLSSDEPKAEDDKT